MTMTALLLIGLTVLAAVLVGWAAYALGAPPIAPPRVQQWDTRPAPPEYLPAHALSTRLRWPGHHLGK